MRETSRTAAGIESTAQSISMLRAVISGETYEGVAARVGVTRTAVERRIKMIAHQLSVSVGVQGLNASGTAFVSRLRLHRDAVLRALDKFEPLTPFGPREVRIVSKEEILLAAQRIKARSLRPWHDMALFYFLFATGARPLEVARLEIRDYVHPDGSVRRMSEMRAAAANNGKSRPLSFACTHLQEALDAWLLQRAQQGSKPSEACLYRGLDPHGRLFLTPGGDGYEIKSCGRPGQQRYLCRPVLEAYRKLFRDSELRGVTPLSVRHTVAARLYERGADESQVGLLLGISDRSAVKDSFPRPHVDVTTLVDELI